MILPILILIFMVFVAIVSVWWIVAETGDMVEEVETEWEPYEALREIQTPAPL